MNKKLEDNELSRIWFDFCFDNPKITPNHCAIYFLSIYYCNRYKSNKLIFSNKIFKELTGIRSDTILDKTFNDLVEWGFFIVVEMPENKYTGKVIRLPKL